MAAKACPPQAVPPHAKGCQRTPLMAVKSMKVDVAVNEEALKLRVKFEVHHPLGLHTRDLIGRETLLAAANVQETIRFTPLRMDLKKSKKFQGLERNFPKKWN